MPRSFPHYSWAALLVALALVPLLACLCLHPVHALINTTSLLLFIYYYSLLFICPWPPPPRSCLGGAGTVPHFCHLVGGGQESCAVVLTLWSYRRYAAVARGGGGCRRGRLRTT
jgi:hypothetical protein